MFIYQVPANIPLTTSMYSHVASHLKYLSTSHLYYRSMYSAINQAK